MAKRYVTRTGKDRNGDITKLCQTGESWSPRLEADAISDIEAGTHEYWVNWTQYPETKIRVVNGTNGKYLRTDRDSTARNNLDDLPDC
ncbi:MAG TPA: DUF3892 domain-containing protein [Allosphingosinicella sp.]|jgi:hypothetical protein